MRDTPTILITGANGQVGHALLTRLAPLGRLVAADMAPLAVGALDSPLSAIESHLVDFLDTAAVAALVRRVRPTVVVNPAAYTAVDKAETDQATCLQVNATAPAALATATREIGAAFLHYSTDYVYDGSGDQHRSEDDPTGPLGVYGSTKLAGERSVLAAHPDAVIMRSSWIFSDHGQNFVKTMLRLGGEREQLKVVADQVGAPTSAAFLADMTAQVILTAQRQQNLSSLGGVYNICCAGVTSWHGFATEIFRLAPLFGIPLAVREVLAIATSDYPTPAARPHNSRLDCRKFCSTFDVVQATWQDCLIPTMRALALPMAKA